MTRSDLSLGRRLMLVPLAALAMLGAACDSATPAASAVQTASAPASRPVVSTSLSAPSPQPSASATPIASAASAAPSRPCVEVGDLADLGEPVMTAMTGIKPALDAGKIDDARALAKTAADGIASMTELVGPASPEAKELFTTAASELKAAASLFPGGAPQMDQARHDLDHAFALAEAMRCAG